MKLSSSCIYLFDLYPFWLLIDEVTHIFALVVKKYYLWQIKGHGHLGTAMIHFGYCLSKCHSKSWWQKIIPFLNIYLLIYLFNLLIFVPYSYPYPKLRLIFFLQVWLFWLKVYPEAYLHRVTFKTFLLPTQFVPSILVENYGIFSIKNFEKILISFLIWRWEPLLNKSLSIRPKSL